MENEFIKKQYPNCSVLEKLKRNNIPPALFIGAGISKRYFKNYPNWLEFIKRIGTYIGLKEIDLDAARYVKEHALEDFQHLDSTTKLEIKRRFREQMYAYCFTPYNIE